MSSSEDFAWLGEAVEQWQKAFTSILREPRNVREEIGIRLPSPKLFPRLSEADVHRYVEMKAHRIGQDRKLTNLYRLWLELQSHRSRIHDVIPSSERERDEDWYQGTACFATEVLDDRISFSCQVSRDIYPLLEGVWLEDVKRIKAYLIWESRGAPFEPDGGLDEYFTACKDLWQRAIDGKRKASLTSFADVRTYVEQMYLSHNRIDSRQDSSAHALIAKKAQRLWELHGGQSSADESWHTAENYVRAFYEHLIPAVLDDEKESEGHHLATVAEAFCAMHRAPAPYDIANAFEAAVLIQYLPADRLRECCRENAWQLM